jgi:hypothetical protein
MLLCGAIRIKQADRARLASKVGFLYGAMFPITQTRLSEMTKTPVESDSQSIVRVRSVFGVLTRVISRN